MTTMDTQKMQRDRAADTAYSQAEALAGWRDSDAERAEAKRGRRLGKIANARTIAVEMLQRDRERIAFDPTYVSEGGGVNDRPDRNGTPRPFTITDEPSTLDEARWIIAEAETVARHAGVYSLSDPSRMTTIDVSRIADRAARTAARMASRVGRKLSRDDFAELKAVCMLDVIERGAKCEPRGYAGLPKWRAIERDGEDADSTLLVDRWGALTFNAARRWVLDRAARLAAEASADASEDDSQRLEDYAAAVSDELAGANATAAEVLASLALSNAERAAILTALTPTRIAELAEREGTSANALMVQAHRGRAKLAERWPTPKAARAELASVPALADDRALRSALSLITRAMAADVPSYHGHALTWPSLRAVEPAPYPYSDGAPWSGRTRWTERIAA